MDDVHAADYMPTIYYITHLLDAPNDTWGKFEIGILMKSIFSFDC